MSSINAASLVEAVWERVKACLGEHAATLEVRPAASEGAVAAVERELGVHLPLDYRAWLLLHDGEGDADGRIEWLPVWGRLLPIEETLARWRDEQEWAQGDDDPGYSSFDDRDRIRRVVKHARRIVIAGNRHGDGDNTYLDLAPGPNGTAGQVIVGVTECDFEVVGSSFVDFLRRWVAAFESGQLTVAAQDGQFRVDWQGKAAASDRWESVLRQVEPGGGHDEECVAERCGDLTANDGVGGGLEASSS
jgi:cell wall assembly regulator SMI1